MAASYKPKIIFFLLALGCFFFAFIRFLPFLPISFVRQLFPDFHRSLDHTKSSPTWETLIGHPIHNKFNASLFKQNSHFYQAQEQQQQPINGTEQAILVNVSQREATNYSGFNISVNFIEHVGRNTSFGNETSSHTGDERVGSSTEKGHVEVKPKLKTHHPHLNLPQEILAKVSNKKDFQAKYERVALTVIQEKESGRQWERVGDEWFELDVALEKEHQAIAEAESKAVESKSFTSIMQQQEREWLLAHPELAPKPPTKPEVKPYLLPPQATTTSTTSSSSKFLRPIREVPRNVAAIPSNINRKLTRPTTQSSQTAATKVTA